MLEVRSCFGLQAPVVKTHGSSDAKAVYSTIRQIRTMLETDVIRKSVVELSELEEEKWVVVKNFKLVEGLIKDHKGSEYEVSLDLDLRKDLEVDSVDLMEYIIYLEEAYQINIPDKDIDAMATVGDMVDYVLKKTSK